MELQVLLAVGVIGGMIAFIIGIGRLPNKPRRANRADDLWK